MGAVKLGVGHTRSLGGNIVSAVIFVTALRVRCDSIWRLFRSRILNLYSIMSRMQVCTERDTPLSFDRLSIHQLVRVSLDIRLGPGDNRRPPPTIKASLPSNTLVSVLPEIVRTKTG